MVEAALVNSRRPPRLYGWLCRVVSTPRRRGRCRSSRLTDSGVAALVVVVAVARGCSSIAEADHYHHYCRNYYCCVHYFFCTYDN